MQWLLIFLAFQLQNGMLIYLTEILSSATGSIQKIRLHCLDPMTKPVKESKVSIESPSESEINKMTSFSLQKSESGRPGQMELDLY
jgi:hypothetical protein